MSSRLMAKGLLVGAIPSPSPGVGSSGGAFYLAQVWSTVLYWVTSTERSPRVLLGLFTNWSTELIRLTYTGLDSHYINCIIPTIAVNMKNCGRQNARKHREIKGSDKYVTLDISLKFDSLDKMIITYL